VIGESLQNTWSARSRRKELCREAKTASAAQSRAITGDVVCFAVKPVGERSAGNPHAAFERGWETG
jgi:mevalonate pyrophosphate decarboxylase